MNYALIRFIVLFDIDTVPMSFLKILQITILILGNASFEHLINAGINLSGISLS